MFFTTLKRALKAGYLGFKRNSWLTAATVMVMVMVLFVLGGLVFMSAIANTALAMLESKVDISIYFTPTADDTSIDAVRKEVESLSTVAEVRYVSRDQALASFRERHNSNALIAEALEELGENPLAASLNIRAKDPTSYAAISEFLLQKNYAAVDKVNYFENQIVIERLGSIFASVRSIGSLLVIFLAVLSVLVAFNTIRLAIYTMRDEISIMRYVGGSQWFIRGPFLVSGILYGTLAAFFSVLLFFPITWFAAPRLELLIPTFNVFNYFIANVLEFSAIMFGTGVFLGLVSSFIAIRRYLEA